MTVRKARTPGQKRKGVVSKHAPVIPVAPPMPVEPVLGAGRRGDAKAQRKRKRRRVLLHPLPLKV